MNIEQAIKILSHAAQGGISLYPWKEEMKAAQLAVGALKRLQDNRRDPGEFDHWWPLPGEDPPPDPEAHGG